MTEWTLLQDAYGSAEAVPALLAAAEQSDTDEGGPWDELWSRLCHQGTVYSASYAALPALARMSQQRRPRRYLAPLYLAAAIVASNDGPEVSTAIRQRYETELTTLRSAALTNLPHAKDDTDFVYALQTLMAFEEGGVWQRHLDGLANGELELACPSCREHLLVDLERPELHVESLADGSLKTTTVVPNPPHATTAEGHLLALTLANNRLSVAAKLPYLFGAATCPRCRAPFRLSQALS